MDNNQPFQASSKVSIEKIIEDIHQTRNRRIADLLQTAGIMNFLEQHFDVFALSQVKIEFLKRDLKQLQSSDLDLVHYSALIRQIKESSTEIAFDNHTLFDQELKAIFQKYVSEK